MMGWWGGSRVEAGKGEVGGGVRFVISLLSSSERGEKIRCEVRDAEREREKEREKE